MQRNRSSAVVIAVVTALVVAACSSGGAGEDVTTTTTVPGPLPVFTAAPPPTTTPTTTSTTLAPTTDTTVVEPRGPDPRVATELGDSRYPGLGNTGYDVDHYTIELAFDPLTGAIEAVTTIDATATERLEVFSLDFIGFDVTGLRVDGTDAASTRSGGELVIAAPTVIPPGEGFTVAVAYEGLPTPWQTPAMGLTIGWHSGPAGEQYVVAEPDAARTWFPANDHPLDTATFTFLVTVPEPLLAITNGTLADTREGPGGVTRVYEVEQPMPTYLATVVIGDYAVIDDPASSELAGFPVRNVLPPDRAATPPPGLELHGEMVQFLEERLGPYPFDLYGIAIVPDFLAALENSTLSIFGTVMVDAPNFESILMHELAHQWFGNHVVLGDWGDIWLNEGFATYAEWLWAEERDGPATYRQIVEGTHRIVTLSDLPPPGNPPADDLFSAAVYVTGGLTLHALREEIGDEAFFATLRTYVERFGGTNARTADFVTVAEEVSGADLDAFFDAWLYSDTVPDL